jgi:hypothetical protein
MTTCLLFAAVSIHAKALGVGAVLVAISYFLQARWGKPGDLPADQMAVATALGLFLLWVLIHVIANLGTGGVDF